MLSFHALCAKQAGTKLNVFKYIQFSFIGLHGRTISDIQTDEFLVDTAVSLPWLSCISW
jgi:hypothetical protein